MTKDELQGIFREIGIDNLVWNPPEGDVIDLDWEPLPDIFPHRGDGAERIFSHPDSEEDPFVGKGSGHLESLLTSECKNLLKDIWEGGNTNSLHHFHCYPISQHQAWADWRRHQNYVGNIWYCYTLQNAAQHYSWTHYPGGNFNQLSAALQAAMRSNRPHYVAFICFKILDWGGVLYRSSSTVYWIRDLILRNPPSLIVELSDAAQVLSAHSSIPLAHIFGPGLTPMNSGSTKIFAAVAIDFSLGWMNPAQDVLILDGRVGAGLGLLARKIGHSMLPHQVIFPWGQPANKRNPSCNHITFPKINNLTNLQRAEFARNAAICIQQVFNQSGPNRLFVEVERALFMIGYDVRTTCTGSNRLCP